MLANLRDTEDIPPLQPPLTPPSRSPPSKVNDHDLSRPDDGNLTHTCQSEMRAENPHAQQRPLVTDQSTAAAVRELSSDPWSLTSDPWFALQRR